MFLFQPKQLNLKWRRCKNAPSNVGYDHHGQVEILEGKLYVRSDGAAILVYIPEEDRWDRYCNAPGGVKDFAMTVMNGQLTIAGGVGFYNDDERKLAVWNKTSKEWEYPYPPMPTARTHGQLISYLHYLIAMGGETHPLFNRQSQANKNVEILDTLRLQWYIAESLPKGCYRPQGVCIVDTLYLLGSSFKFLRASLPTLVSLATSNHEAATPTWEMLPDIPFQCSGLVAYENSLLGFGHSRSERITGIHAYNADTNKWTKIGDLPTVFVVKLCIVLLSNEVFVICSQYTYRRDEYEVYIGIPDSV